MSAAEALFAGLIDYAGLYPPASLDMRAAVKNFLEYQAGSHASALGRFIVDVTRIAELRAAAGNDLGTMRLSILAAPASDFSPLLSIATQCEVGSVEIKTDQSLTITRLCSEIPEHVARYFEIPWTMAGSNAIDALAAVGCNAKLRMGGVVPEVIPSPESAAATIHRLCDRSVAFKATAGLHHPIRSRHALTESPDAPQAMMHGFVNLFCAAGAVWFGADGGTARAILEEEDPEAFHVNRNEIGWRSQTWSQAQVETIRRKFFTSFGSCSFVEPMREVEALGWL